MYKLTCDIQVGGLRFSFVNNVEINAGVKERTATATIRLPKKVHVKKGARLIPLEDVVKSGDTVTIRLGYDNNLHTEFIGYVRSIVPGPPMEIICEDAMYLFKRQTVAPKVITGTVTDVLKYIAPGYDYEVLDSTLGGTFKIDKSVDTTLKALVALEEVYGLKAFFRLVNEKPVLTVGRLYSAASQAGQAPVKYGLNKNIVSHSLELQQGEDVQVRVEVKSRQANGKTLRNKFKGDDGGEVRSFATPNLTQEQVEQYAQDLYNGAKTNRFTGSIVTFGLPYIQHGMSAHITTEGYEIEQTTNLVDEVNISFGTGGFRRTVVLGYKISN